MPNGYSVVPNVLPGNVTIGGNLTVGGDQVRIGAATPYVRIGKDVFSKLLLSYNIDFNNFTLDNGAQGSQSLGMNLTGTALSFNRTNSLGQGNAMALSAPLLTDFTFHNNTGNTAENTIYSKLIRGGVIGANGGIHAHVLMLAPTQGAVATFVRFKFGGATLLASNFSAVSNVIWDLWLLNNNNQANNNMHQLTRNITTAAFNGSQAQFAVDTSVDQTFSITAQSGANTDNQQFQACIVELVNSFGPV
jgi:hypothetical protein